MRTIASKHEVDLEALEQEAEAFVKSSVLTLSKSWDIDEYAKLFHPRLSSLTTPATLLFDKIRPIGALQHIDSVEGDINAIDDGSSSLNISGKYTVKATYIKDEATINISLIYDSNQWYLLNFEVLSNFFISL
jgi:hypothetical protein